MVNDAGKATNSCTITGLLEQLEDERFFYLKEKEFFCKELSGKKLSKGHEIAGNIKEQYCNIASHQKMNEHIEQYENEMANMKLKVQSLQMKLEQNSSLSSSLCQKFLRMKHTRDKISSEYTKLQGEYLKVMAEMMKQLDDTRREVNLLIDEQFQRPLNPSNAVMLQVLQRNSRLMHENSQLRLEIQKAKTIVGKNNQYEGKTLQMGNTRLSSHVIRHYSTSVLENTRNAEKHSVTQRSKTRTRKAGKVHKSDASLHSKVSPSTAISPLKSAHLKNMDCTTRSPENSEVDYWWGNSTHPSRTMSAPEIIQSSIFKQLIRKHPPTRESSTNT